MKDEVETPLRSMAVKGEWGKQGTVCHIGAGNDLRSPWLTRGGDYFCQYDSNIERTIKHLESCQTRLAKVRCSTALSQSSSDTNPSAFVNLPYRLKRRRRPRAKTRSSPR